MQQAEATERVVHSTFSVERSYPTSPARVFAAFADPAKKRRWFAEGEGFTIDEFTLDFRVGGWETSRFRFGDGEPMRNDTVFLDIVAGRRIIWSYTMFVGERCISVSQATVEIVAEQSGARLVYTEQGAYLEGADQAPDRAHGVAEQLEQLAVELDAHA